METYRSGDGCERCRWQMKRATRSGSGQNFCTQVLKILGTATGHNRTSRSIKINIELTLPLEFNIYGDVSKWS